MKIILLSEGRTGSYSVMEWIKKHFNYKIIEELIPFDYINNQNFILKRTLSNNDFDLDDLVYFDKIIILYRENTFEQAESSIYAILNKKWHHTNGTNDGYYEMDEQFLIDHHDDIWKSVRNYEEYLKTYKSINVGLKISYEEIFVFKTGQKKLEEYLDINSTFSLDDNFNKLRKINNLSTINSLIREIKKIRNELEKKNEEIDGLYKKNNDLINRIKQTNDILNSKLHISKTKKTLI